MDSHRQTRTASPSSFPSSPLLISPPPLAFLTSSLLSPAHSRHLFTVLPPPSRSSVPFPPAVASPGTHPGVDDEGRRYPPLSQVSIYSDLPISGFGPLILSLSRSRPRSQSSLGPYPDVDHGSFEVRTTILYPLSRLSHRIQENSAGREWPKTDPQ